MATLITKNSSTASSVPTAAQLVQGELAVNVTDKRLFTQNASDQVVELGTNPSSLALPNGSANGVAYLNGSKVLTTGSALTFDGTGLSVTGSTSATLKLNGRSSDNASSANFYDNTGATRYGFFYFDPSNAQIATSNATPLAFLINSSEQMRLTSTGLGIGTSSPAQRLDVRGGSIVVDTASAGLNPTVFFDHDNFASGTRNYIQMNRGTEAMLFGVANSDRMTLDSAGNLGLGVTPSAWDGNWNAMQFGAGGALAGYKFDRGTVFGANFYNNGGWKYRSNGYATQFNCQDSGIFAWFTAPSGTAGNAISFTQAMTLDASGDLLVGTTSSYFARVNLSWNSSSQSGIILRTSSATLNGNPLIFQDSGGVARGSVSQTATAVAYNTSSDYRLKENIAPMTGALAKVQALKPCTYNWKADGSEGEGFIAHELAEVVPGCVTGEKDAVDENGNPVYQGIDTSFLVATLTAAIQELKASLDEVKLEFDAYKASHP